LRNRTKIRARLGVPIKTGAPTNYGEASKFVGTLGYHRRR
jgi:hypothetical protein